MSGATAGAVAGTIVAMRQKCIENMSTYPNCESLVNGSQSISISPTVLIIGGIIILGLLILGLFKKRSKR